MRTLLLALLVAATPASAAVSSGGASGLTFTGALGGGVEIGSSASTGLSEVELGLGWELGDLRPELGFLVGLSPGSYLGVRPGLHAALPGGPFYSRVALDWAHAGGEWKFRWLLVGVGGELRITSVLGTFVEADAGIPLTSSAGLGLLARAGFAFRF